MYSDLFSPNQMLSLCFADHGILVLTYTLCQLIPASPSVIMYE